MRIQGRVAPTLSSFQRIWSKRTPNFNRTVAYGQDTTYNQVMIEDTFRKIKSRLEQSPELSEKHRQELDELIQSLAEQTAELSKTRPEDSKSISEFANLSTQEAVRNSKRPDLLRHSLDGLSASVIGMEAEHPQIAGLVNRLCSHLSNMGI